MLCCRALSLGNCEVVDDHENQRGSKSKRQRKADCKAQHKTRRSLAREELVPVATAQAVTRDQCLSFPSDLPSPPPSPSLSPFPPLLELLGLPPPWLSPVELSEPPAP